MLWKKRTIHITSKRTDGKAQGMLSHMLGTGHSSKLLDFLRMKSKDNWGATIGRQGMHGREYPIVVAIRASALPLDILSMRERAILCCLYTRGTLSGSAK